MIPNLISCSWKFTEKISIEKKVFVQNQSTTIVRSRESVALFRVNKKNTQGRRIEEQDLTNEPYAHTHTRTRIQYVQYGTLTLRAI